MFQFFHTDLIVCDLFLVHEGQQFPHIFEFEVCEFLLQFWKQFVEYLLILLEF